MKSAEVSIPLQPVGTESAPREEITLNLPENGTSQGYFTRFKNWCVSLCPPKSYIGKCVLGAGLFVAGVAIGCALGVTYAGNRMSESFNTSVADRVTVAATPFKHFVKTTGRPSSRIDPTSAGFITDALDPHSKYVTQWANRDDMPTWVNTGGSSTQASRKKKVTVSATKTTPEQKQKTVSTPASPQPSVKTSTATSNPEKSMEILRTTSSPEKPMNTPTAAPNPEQAVKTPPTTSEMKETPSVSTPATDRAGEVSTIDNKRLDLQSERERYLKALQQAMGETEQAPVPEADTPPIEGRPWAEYEAPGYLVFSDDTTTNAPTYESRKIKRKLARHLPQTVDLVVYTNAERTDHIRKTFGPLVGEERLHVLQIPQRDTNLMWARDTLALPVVDQTGTLKLIGREKTYFHADERLAEVLDVELLQKPQHEVIGGNFMADIRGNCVVVNTNNTRPIPDRTYTHHYGCKTLTRLPHLSGIGDVDEVVKFINPDNVVTNLPAYRQTFEALGYTVTLLPQADNRFETYVNSLITGNTLFMPTYGQPTDKVARNIYKSFGFRVFGMRSNNLSQHFEGSIHCITMTYPKQVTMGYPSFNETQSQASSTRHLG